MQLSDNQLVAFVFLHLLTFATTLATKLNLAPVDSHENIRPFKLAKLDDAKGDLSKRWFVYFYVWDEQKNKQVRKREYISTKYKTALERRAAAKMLIKEINELLQDGMIIRNPHNVKKQDTIKKEVQVFSIAEAFEKVIEIKEATLRYKSTDKLKGIAKIFTAFIRPKLYLHQLEKTDFIRYSDYLLTVIKNQASTRNDHIEKLRHMFNLMIERQWMVKNPTLGIKKLRVIKSKKNKAFSLPEQQIILDAADPQLLLSIQFIFYCYLRPNEVRLMTINQIELENKCFITNEKVAKNKKSEAIIIPKPFIRVLEKLNLESYNPNHFLIGKTKNRVYTVKPNDTPFGSNTISERHGKILRKNGLYNGDETFYGWKHTGVVAAYRAGVDIKSIQLQCRHHDLAETDTYLKAMGLFRDNEIFDKMPEL